MNHQIAILGTEIVFPCAPDETVLDAAERAGYQLPYSCRKGVCASCEARLESGAAALGASGIPVEAPADAVRLCQARPQGELTVGPVPVVARRPPVRRRIAATVFRLEAPRPDIRILHLRFPIGRRIPFQAGQYARIILPDGQSRNYSLANPSRDNDAALLHVRVMPGGAFSDRFLGGLAVGDEVELETPFGLFTLSDADGTPAILLATGTGFAPMRSIVEGLARGPVRRQVRLYWGGRQADDLYALDEVRRWERQFPWFGFVPVLSRGPAPAWARAGHVQNAVLADWPDLSAAEVYACGSPAMVRDARQLLVDRAGLPPEAFHADSFVPADPVADLTGEAHRAIA